MTGAAEKPVGEKVAENLAHKGKAQQAQGQAKQAGLPVWQTHTYLTLAFFKSIMWRIKRELVESICEAAQNTYPQEFLALIGGDPDNNLIEELVMVPAIYGEKFSSLRRDLIPLDFSIIGTVHSHPSRHLRASRGDLVAFPKLGQVHLIIGLPFDLSSLKLFDNKGKELEYEVI